MTATDAQVRIIMREREKDRIQEQATASANLTKTPLNPVSTRLDWRRYCLVRWYCAGMEMFGSRGTICRKV